MKPPSLTAPQNGTAGEKGLGLIEIIGIVAVVTIALLASIQLTAQLLKGSASEASLANLDSFRRGIVFMVTDSAPLPNNAWARTVAVNPGMACLSGGNGATCAVGVRSRFNLYDSFGNVVYASATNGNGNGINEHGIRCGPNGDPGYTSYSFPSARCPFQYIFEWSALNNDPYPIVAVIVTLVIGRSAAGPYSKLIFNPDHYAFALPPNVNWPTGGPAPAPGSWPGTLIYRRAL